jgi:thiol-disulfide isomerase/thioredoxin
VAPQLRAAETNAAPATNAPAADPAADKAWNDLQKALRPPNPPADWNGRQPSEAERQAFNEETGKALLNAIEKLKAFQTSFPNSSHTATAATIEKSYSRQAQQMGLVSGAAAAPQNEEQQMAEMAKREEAIQQKVSELSDRALKKQSEGTLAVLNELSAGLEPIAEQYQSEEVAQMAMAVNQTKMIFKQYGAIGKPFNLKFTALDGRQVDLSSMKGKVVLIDFWATWCMPCLMTMPAVHAAYEKYHDKGFEIIGISLDEDKAALTKFVKEKNMTWPQYFDGLHWQNKIARANGINSIPAMWLIDKKGNLRSLNARFGLDEQIAKLLAEK